MSQTAKVSKLTIRNRPGTEGRISTGSNTEVLLDGTPIRGASFVKIECKAAKVTKVVIEMFAEVEAEVYAALEEGDKKQSGFHKVNGGHYAQYEISNPSPKNIADKK